MPTYYYTTIGGDGTGELQSGSVTADTDAEAEEKVRALYKFRTEILRLSINTLSPEDAQKEIHLKTPLSPLPNATTKKD